MTPIVQSRSIIAAAVLAVSGLLAALPAAPARAGAAEALAGIEADVRTQFPNVAHLPSTELAKMMERQEPLLLLDAREDAEHAVSRLPGSKRIAPGASAEEFKTQFGTFSAGRTVVVYCSVGMRSSRLAKRIADMAKASGARAIYNLEGGIFRWHNEARPLDRGHSATDEVHPYSRRWQTYLARQDRAAYRPGEALVAP